MADVLRDLGTWTSVTGDEQVSTLHLLAALAGSATPEGAFLRQNRLTSDAVLTIGARCRAEVGGDDAAFARDHAGDADAVFSVPDAPTPDDLTTRTGGRRSATAARIMGHHLPRGNRLNTRLGVARMRWWAVSHTLNYLVTLSAVLLFVDQALGAGPWWLGFCAVLVSIQLSAVPWSVWLTVKVVSLWLAPPPLSWVVLGSIVFELAEFRDKLWMKRVDRAEPGLPSGYFWRAYWREMFAMGMDRMGADRHEN
ncbi:hypothetical protein [Streptomyces sp. NTH33]|uniref:hypothetical protein n=1 Tax=Streptomyces sp. NTH33 TaxID=1735453 RepID=UPI0011B9381F|nr:hypothetical protein [Streptomyces sp. NTH33]